jgi:hypothetical protein
MCRRAAVGRRRRGDVRNRAHNTINNNGSLRAGQMGTEASSRLSLTRGLHQCFVLHPPCPSKASGGRLVITKCSASTDAGGGRRQASDEGRQGVEGCIVQRWAGTGGVESSAGRAGGFRERLGRYPVLSLSPASALAFLASVRGLGFSTRDTRRSYVLRTEASFAAGPACVPTASHDVPLPEVPPLQRTPLHRRPQFGGTWPPPHAGGERSKSRRKRVGGRMRRWAAVRRGRQGDARDVIQSLEQVRW